MQELVKRSIIILAAASLLSACSSGGGGSTTPTAVTSSVSGTAVVTSGVADPAAAAKAAAETPLEGAKVTILSYDTAGILKQTVETVTQASGGFSANVTALPGGGTISVKIEKQGEQKLTAFEKSFKYATASELAAGLLIQAKLDPVLVKVIATTTPDFDAAAAKSAATTDIISLAVVKDSRGVKSIVSNSAITAAKASGKTVTWQIDVAKSALKADTTSLVMQAQNYNPANPDDMTRFATDQTDDNKKLVSAGFDFIDIKDQNGVPLKITKAAAAKARKTTAIGYAIKKQIPDCKLILKDEDGNPSNGVQIGFYVMANGRWQKLGLATLYNDIGTATTDPQLYTMPTGSCSGKPYAILTDADISKDIDFDVRWFNFDHVAFGDIKTACVEGSFELSKGGTTSPLGGLSIYLNDLKNGNTQVTGFQSAYGNVKNDGTYHLEFVYTANSIATPTASFSYYEPTAGQQGNQNLVLSSTKNANGCYTVSKITVTAPDCTVTGKLLKSDGSPASYRGVQIYEPSSYNGYRWLSTNQAGVYESRVQCDTDYMVNADGLTKSFHVNKKDTTAPLGPDEKSDDGTTVTMKDITKSNQEPQAYIGTGNNSVMVNNTVNLYGYGYDPDGDNLSYAWTATCGTLSANSGTQATWTAPATAPDGNTCRITLTANDGSLTGTASTDIYVSATSNRPPIISSLFVPGSISSGQSSNLSAYAYDYDSTTLTYNWTATCGTLANATTPNPTWTAPTVTGTSSSPCSITATVSDGTTSISKSGTVQVQPNRPPSIYGVNVPTSAALSAALKLVASAYDPNGDALSWSWSIISGGGTLGTGCNGSDTTVSSNCSYTAPSTESTVTVRFTVDDGKNTAVSVDKTISVSNATGTVNVVVQ